jgi:hypothetical protein
MISIQKNGDVEDGLLFGLPHDHFVISTKRSERSTSHIAQKTRETHPEVQPGTCLVANVAALKYSQQQPVPWPCHGMVISWKESLNPEHLLGI